MNERRERILLSLVLSAFFLLLLGGGRRLFSHQTEPAVWDTAAETSLCACAPAEPAGAVKRTEARRTHIERNVPQRTAGIVRPVSFERDANGNILRGMCYTSCVYAAFAPEDGFS